VIAIAVVIPLIVIAVSGVLVYFLYFKKKGQPPGHKPVSSRDPWEDQAKAHHNSNPNIVNDPNTTSYVSNAEPKSALRKPRSHQGSAYPQGMTDPPSNQPITHHGAPNISHEPLLMHGVTDATYTPPLNAQPRPRSRSRPSSIADSLDSQSQMAGQGIGPTSYAHGDMQPKKVPPPTKPKPKQPSPPEPQHPIMGSQAHGYEEMYPQDQPHQQRQTQKNRVPGGVPMYHMGQPPQPPKPAPRNKHESSFDGTVV
jgi:hypothetical protein